MILTKTVKMKHTNITYSIEEARRYVANAEDVIKKSGYDPETKSYLDSKYIKTAGNILWCGCLIALESIFHVHTGKGDPLLKNIGKLPKSETKNCCNS